MNLLLSLSTGVGLIAITTLLLWRFSSLSARASAAIAAVAIIALGAPLALLLGPSIDVVAIHLAIYLLTALAFGIVLSNRRKGQRSSRMLHWGPALIIGFFVCLVLVDSTFVIMAERGLTSKLTAKLLPEPRYTELASSGFPGVVSHDFQKRKDLFNEYQLQFAEQQKRGWRIRKGWLRQPVSHRPAVFQIQATTRDGDPLTRAEISGRFLRPSDSRLDTPFAMEEVKPGFYQANLSLPAAGTWQLVMELRKGDDRHQIRASTSVMAP
jgi:nitrogen fixation protein FixH